METLIPVICESEACGICFWTTSFISVSPGSTLELAENHIGPCPNCGNMGLVPAGTYVQTDLETLFTPASAADRLLLKRAMTIARDVLDGKMTSDVGKDEAQNTIPELKPLWDIIPRNRQEAYQFWRLVLAIIQLASSHLDNVPFLLPSVFMQAYSWMTKKTDRS